MEKKERMIMKFDQIIKTHYVMKVRIRNSPLVCLSF